MPKSMPSQNLALEANALLIRIQVKGKAGCRRHNAMLTELEVLALRDNAKFLCSSSPKQIVNRATRLTRKQYSDAELDIVSSFIWRQLSYSFRMALSSRGCIAPGCFMNPKTGIHGKLNMSRGKFLLKRFIEQGGACAYTGLPITLSSCDLEHIQPYGLYSLDAEHEDNLVFVTQAVNQRKGNSSLAEFFEFQMAAIAEAMNSDPDYWAKQELLRHGKVNKQQMCLDLMINRSPDSWTNADIKLLGIKYYYIGRALGHSLQYCSLGQRGRSVRSLPKLIGKPLAEAFAEAYRLHDAGRIAQLEYIRDLIVKAAVAESAQSKRAASVKGGLMLNAWDLFKLRVQPSELV